MKRSDFLLVIVCSFLACLGGMLAGYKAGRSSAQQQMVRCEQKNTSNEPGTYMCLPVTQ